MRHPKPFEEWTFDELVTWACWEVMASFTKGENLRASMYRVLQSALGWKPPKVK